MARPPSRGRRKIKMNLIENKGARAVTLSRRHQGLFKKAGELATLCGVHIAIILFTIGGRPLSFGSPSVKDVLRKFLSSDHVEAEPNFTKASDNSVLESEFGELNRELDAFNEKLAIDHKHGKTLEANLKPFLGGKSYEDYKSSIGVDKLMWLKHKLEEMKKDLEKSSDVESGSCSFKFEHDVDLSKIEGPRDYLKL